jgi:uncharacterized repeat protein (TIGR04076 family)
MLMCHIVGLDSSELKQLEKSILKALSKVIDRLSELKSPNTLNEEDWIILMAAFPIFAMTTNVFALKADLVDRGSIAKTWTTAREEMKTIPVPDSFKPLSVKVIEKRGVCPAYEIGDSFEIPSPFYWPKRCPALWFSIWPYLIAAGFGYKSWEGDNPSIFRISCPSKKGIVLEMMKTKLIDSK